MHPQVHHVKTNYGGGQQKSKNIIFIRFILILNLFHLLRIFCLQNSYKIPKIFFPKVCPILNIDVNNNENPRKKRLRAPSSYTQYSSFAYVLDFAKLFLFKFLKQFFSAMSCKPSSFFRLLITSWCQTMFKISFTHLLEAQSPSWDRLTKQLGSNKLVRNSCSTLTKTRFQMAVDTGSAMFNGKVHSSELPLTDSDCTHHQQ